MEHFAGAGTRLTKWVWALVFTCEMLNVPAVWVFVL